jgi:hypothetical protein
MPLARYFLYIGGALLALLFISDPYLPKLPVADWGNSRSAVIHIHSDQKWPERVVYDTSLPTVVPVQIANIEANAPAPEKVASAPEREAFAQLQPSSQLRHRHLLRRERPTVRKPHGFRGEIQLRRNDGGTPVAAFRHGTDGPERRPVDPGHGD